MPKLPRTDARRLIAALKRLGFEEDTQSGSHLTLYNPVTDRHTTIPRHGGTIPIGTLHHILRQAGVSREQLLDVLK